MKSDRIFLNNDPNTYSEQEFNGIDLSVVATKLASAGTAKTNETLPKELLAAITGEGEEGSVYERNRKILAGSADHLKEWQFGKKKEDGESDDEGDKKDKKGDEEEGEEGAEKTASRRIHFSSADQISAAAIRTAEANGDFALKEAILDVRDKLRNRLGNDIDVQAQVIVEKNAKLAKRKNYRLTVVANSKAAKKLVEAAKKADKQVSEKSDGFKAGNSLSKAEKSAFLRKAEAAGYSKEYIASFLGEPTSPAISEIQSVMASDLNTSVKIAAVRGLIREANLDQANLDRCKRYWIDELGYSDESWVNDLYSNKFETTSGSDNGTTV